MKYRIETTYSVQEQNDEGVWVTVMDSLGDRMVFGTKSGAVKALDTLQPKYRVDACLCKGSDGRLSAGYRIEIRQGRRWYGAEQDGVPLIFKTEEKAKEILKRLEEA